MKAGVTHDLSGLPSRCRTVGLSETKYQQAEALSTKHRTGMACDVVDF